MPVTFPVVNHPAQPYVHNVYRSQALSGDEHEILAGLPTTNMPTRLLQSSVDGIQKVMPQMNGFVLGVLMAYNKHHNLVIRPDDVWIAIVSQLNFYINAHAEELRDKFVSHEAKKDLVVVSSASIDKADFGDLAVQMGEQIGQNVKDKSLIPWVLPNFSTTTPNDTVICSALIMSTLRQYFDYITMVGCGIPSITIEGTQADWQSILDRIDKIPEFGSEPAEWSNMLRAILRRFIRAFDKDGPIKDKKFWERIIHEEAGSNAYYLGGWMTAFCAWDNKGTFFESKKSQGKSSNWFSIKNKEAPDWVHRLTYDGVWFPRVWSPPEGYAEIDVLVTDLETRKTHDCTIVAGHIGFSMSGEENLDTLHMAPQWFLYVKGAKREANSSFWIT